MMGERMGVMVRKIGRSVEIIDIFTPPISDFMWSSSTKEVILCDLLLTNRRELPHCTKPVAMAAWTVFRFY